MLQVHYKMIAIFSCTVHFWLLRFVLIVDFRFTVILNLVLQCCMVLCS